MATLQVAGVPPKCDAGAHEPAADAGFNVLDDAGKVVAHSCQRHAAGALVRQQDVENAVEHRKATPKLPETPKEAGEDK